MGFLVDPKFWARWVSIALSLPLVVWGSGILARLMNRYPWIIWFGGGILGYVAAEMMLKDDWIKEPDRSRLVAGAAQRGRSRAGLT